MAKKKKKNKKKKNKNRVKNNNPKKVINNQVVPNIVQTPYINQGMNNPSILQTPNISTSTVSPINNVIDTNSIELTQEMIDGRFRRTVDEIKNGVNVEDNTKYLSQFDKDTFQRYYDELNIKNASSPNAYNGNSHLDLDNTTRQNIVFNKESSPEEIIDFLKNDYDYIQSEKYLYRDGRELKFDSVKAAEEIANPTMSGFDIVNMERKDYGNKNIPKKGRVAHLHEKKIGDIKDGTYERIDLFADFENKEFRTTYSGLEKDPTTGEIKPRTPKSITYNDETNKVEINDFKNKHEANRFSVGEFEYNEARGKYQFHRKPKNITKQEPSRQRRRGNAGVSNVEEVAKNMNAMNIVNSGNAETKGFDEAVDRYNNSVNKIHNLEYSYEDFKKGINTFKNGEYNLEVRNSMGNNREVVQDYIKRYVDENYDNAAYEQFKKDLDVLENGDIDSEGFYEAAERVRSANDSGSWNVMNLEYDEDGNININKFLDDINENNSNNIKGRKEINKHNKEKIHNRRREAKDEFKKNGNQSAPKTYRELAARKKKEEARARQEQARKKREKILAEKQKKIDDYNAFKEETKFKDKDEKRNKKRREKERRKEAAFAEEQRRKKEALEKVQKEKIDRDAKVDEIRQRANDRTIPKRERKQARKDLEEELTSPIDSEIQGRIDTAQAEVDVSQAEYDKKNQRKEEIIKKRSDKLDRYEELKKRTKDPSSYTKRERKRMRKELLELEKDKDIEVERKRRAYEQKNTNADDVILNANKNTVEDFLEERYDIKATNKDYNQLVDDLDSVGRDLFDIDGNALDPRLQKLNVALGKAEKRVKGFFKGSWEERKKRGFFKGDYTEYDEYVAAVERIQNLDPDRVYEHYETENLFNERGNLHNTDDYRHLESGKDSAKDVIEKWQKKRVKADDIADAGESALKGKNISMKNLANSNPKLKRLMSIGGTASLGMNLFLGAQTYKEAIKEGHSVFGSVARGVADFALGEALGVMYPISMFAQQLPSMAVKGIEGLGKLTREKNNMQRHEAFGYANFQDTQQLATMRQSGMEMAKMANYNLQQTLMGNEAKYMHR